MVEKKEGKTIGHRVRKERAMIESRRDKSKRLDREERKAILKIRGNSMGIAKK